MNLAGSLLEVAEDLAAPRPGETRPLQARLRRALSTAYYALFHLLVAAAARRMFANDAERREFGPLAMRAFTHTQVKAVLNDATKPPGSRRADTNRVLGATPVSQDVELVCKTFVEAHAHREEADYDTTVRYRRSVVDARIESVRDAFSAWSRASATDDGQRLLIALLLYARGR